MPGRAVALAVLWLCSGFPTVDAIQVVSDRRNETAFGGGQTRHAADELSSVGGAFLETAQARDRGARQQHNLAGGKRVLEVLGGGALSSSAGSRGSRRGSRSRELENASLGDHAEAGLIDLGHALELPSPEVVIEPVEHLKTTVEETARPGRMNASSLLATFRDLWAAGRPDPVTYRGLDERAMKHHTTAPWMKALKGLSESERVDPLGFSDSIEARTGHFNPPGMGKETNLKQREISYEGFLIAAILTGIFVVTVACAAVMLLYFNYLGHMEASRLLRRRSLNNEERRFGFGHEIVAGAALGAHAPRRDSRIAASASTRVIAGGEGAADAQAPEGDERRASARRGSLARSLRCGSETQVTPADLNMRSGSRPNLVSTTRFTPLTWLPLSFWDQFQRIVILYYAYISAICVLGSLSSQPPWNFSPRKWASMVIPFIGVMLWTALKDLYEDLNKRRDDMKENSRATIRYDNESAAFVETEWQDVLYGDLLYIEANNAFPADLLLLRSCGGHEAFVSTANLDGETNLKERQCPDLFKSCHVAGPAGVTLSTEHREALVLGEARLAEAHEEALRFARNMNLGRLLVQCGPPELALTRVDAILELEGSRCAADDSHFLPRGCVLRSTPWVVGLVLYAGDETKTRLQTLNGPQFASKTSRTSNDLNRYVLGLLAFWALWCLYCAAMGVALTPWGLLRYGVLFSLLLNVFVYNIVFYAVVPISLYVTIEMMKMILAYKVNFDEQMYYPSVADPEVLEGAAMRNMELVEELGQVDFLFSDKTGTLTANEMVFARCSVGGEDLGDFRRAARHGGSPSSMSSASPAPAGMATSQQVLSDRSDPRFDEIRWFFLCLALCHSCHAQRLSEEEDSSAARSKQSIEYSGASPDEVALVQVASDVGVVFEDRARRAGGATGFELAVRGPDTEPLRDYTVLYELPFTSERKRMSVIVRGSAPGELWCITKGADSFMMPLLKDEAAIDGTVLSKRIDNMKHLEAFSREGLRTLLVASRPLDSAFFREWETEYQSALLMPRDQREERMPRLYAQVETAMDMVGITAVEDRLQDGVPETIEKLREAGIRIWVLTGDKTETAIDIARSAALFKDDTTMAMAIEARNSSDAVRQLNAAAQQLSASSSCSKALVLDGITVHYCLENGDARRLIYELGLICTSCLCCRLSPVQKLRLIELVKSMNGRATTMAIGDGANDVPMISGAHIGVGLRGREGNQAAMSSDVAISQFRHLQPLLFCHGRRAYHRMSIMVLFYLYKNIALIMADFIFTYESQFTGLQAYAEWLGMGYNLCFTSWHMLILLGYFEDVSDKVSLQTPELYRAGPERAYFHGGLFTNWMLYAAWHGTIAWVIPHAWFGGDVYTPDDPNCPFWLASNCSFFICVIAVVARLVLVLPTTCTYINFMSSLAAIGTFFPWAFVLSYTWIGAIMQPNQQGLLLKMFTTRESVISMLVVPWLCLLPDLLEKLQRTLCPTSLDEKLATAAPPKIA
eukprot:TRINITY_DN26983_c0_g1_i1.p1 TRINITY_DN26983_c0_g1~~TRINITY_DN26983_c0_g1_i1.p1  ORF type:complete len:1486 (-),score=310.89 TRINITY_DN26983_c0_g1_i1:62-4519(-)